MDNVTVCAGHDSLKAYDRGEGKKEEEKKGVIQKRYLCNQERGKTGRKGEREKRKNLEKERKKKNTNIE